MERGYDGRVDASDASDKRQDRARARASWPGRMSRIEDAEDVGLLDLPPGRLMALVTELTRAAWAMRGASIPDYPRHASPGRIVRPSDRG